MKKQNKIIIFLIILISIIYFIDLISATKIGGIKILQKLQKYEENHKNSNEGPKEEELCDPKDLFPCSSSIVGNIVLIFLYGFFILLGAKIISDGSELLLEILDPGFIGGVVLPVLGALPDGMMIFMSAALVDSKTAKDQLTVGMGTLAGSTCFLLTIPWSISLFLARCDFTKKLDVKDKTLKRWYNPFTTGIRLPIDVPLTAFIMILSTGSYWIVQGITFYFIFNHTSESEKATKIEKWFSLAATIVCIILFIGYAIFMFCFNKIQERRMRAVQDKRKKEKMEKIRFERFQKHKLLILNAFAPKLKPNLKKRNKLNKKDFDEQGNENTPLVINDKNQIQNYQQEDQEVNQNSEFAEKMNSLKFFNRWKEKALNEKEEEEDKNEVEIENNENQDKDNNDNEEGKKIENIEKEEEEEIEEEAELTFFEKIKIGGKSIFLLLIGVSLVTVFSDPMVDAISNMGKLINVPAFYLSFVITPICSNASETISSFIFASKKTKKNTAITFSQIYGACTMNNTMCLGIFTILIFWKELPWTYSSEVLCIVFANVVMGIVGLCPIIPTIVGIPAFLFYFVCIGLVVFCEKVLQLK